MVKNLSCILTYQAYISLIHENVSYIVESLFYYRNEGGKGEWDSNLVMTALQLTPRWARARVYMYNEEFLKSLKGDLYTNLSPVTNIRHCM